MLVFLPTLTSTLTFLLLAAQLVPVSHAAAVPNRAPGDFPPRQLIPNPDPHIEKRDDLGVYLCSEPGFTGMCRHNKHPEGYCSDLSTIAWDGGVSSFGPDRYIICHVYSEYGCNPDRGETRTFVHPGEGDLARLGWDDAILSYKCVWSPE